MTKNRLPPTREVRAFPQNRLEIRETEDGEPRITGYAAVFDRLSEPLFDWVDGAYREKIARGAFAKTIREADVRALLNHNPDYVLGRNRAQTLALREDDYGLAIEIQPPETVWARDLITSMRRGDVNQMSFAFQVIKDEWRVDHDPATGKKATVRTLVEVRLWDVSVVTFPAYTETEANVRALGGLTAEVDFARALTALAQYRRGAALDDDDLTMIRAAIDELRAVVSSAEPVADHSVLPGARCSEPARCHSVELLRRRLAITAKLVA